MSDLMMPRFPAQPVASRPLHGAGVDRLLVWLRQALRTYLTRQALPDLSPSQLVDIGVSRSMAMAEAARLPWDFAPLSDNSISANGAARGALGRARMRHLAARLDKTTLSSGDVI